MPLDEYARKRDFTRSPEPPGRRGRRSPGGRSPRFFCVQKHLASQLHYDLRLEHEGVLLSWAVPKGPSLDPTTKRLAMHVEDHPVEYGEFEGVIPSGYGMGIVMLWDRGTWTPEVDDVGAALRKGDLKFTLDGYKLKGSWVLVRTRGRWDGSGRGGAESWLLIKHRDDWAGAVDITAFAPLSVKSEGDFVDILQQDRPEIWESSRPGAAGEDDQALARIVARAIAMRAPSPGGTAAAPSSGRPRRAASKGAARQPATAAAPASSAARARKTAVTAPRKARIRRPARRGAGDAETRGPVL